MTGHLSEPQRRVFPRLAPALALSPWLLSACQPAPDPLRLGLHTWPGYEFLHLARSLGHLDNRQQMQGPTPALEVAASELAGLMLNAGLISAAPALQGLSTPDFLPRPS